MTRKTSKTAISLSMLLAFGLNGCAAISPEKHAPPAAEPLADISYQVENGDRLGDIALRLTGKVSNWQAIAARNDISNPRTLAIGKVLIIPGDLIEVENPLTVSVTADTEQAPGTPNRFSAKSSDNAVYSAEASTASESDLAGNSTAAHTASAPPVTTGAGVSVVRGQSVQDTASAEDPVDITVSAVTINRTFDLEPIDEPLITDQADQQYDSEQPRIKVTGTYYPKGVYSQPANYSPLMGRAAPGTIFKLDSEVNDWYKIITDQGIGYIRQSDSSLVK